MIITSRSATILRVLGTHTGYPLSLSVHRKNIPSIALGSSLLTSLSLFLMKIDQTKFKNLLTEILGLIPRISTAEHFPTPRLTIKFLIFAAWRIAALHIILGGSESTSKNLAISSSVLLHLSAKPFCCGMSGMLFSCKMPASKQYILNCSERNSFVLSYLCF